MQPAGRDVLIFALGGRRFGLPVCCVKELVRAVSTVALPYAPGVVEGVMNLRGRIVPVLDLRAGLALPPKPVEPSDLLIIVRSGDDLQAIRVDSASGLMTTEAAAGVVRLPGELAPVLDPRHFLTAAESEALHEALSGPVETASVEAPP